MNKARAALPLTEMEQEMLSALEQMVSARPVCRGKLLEGERSFIKDEQRIAIAAEDAAMAVIRKAREKR